MSRRLLLSSGGRSGGGTPVDPLDPDLDALKTSWFGEHSGAMQPEWETVLRVGPTRTLSTIADGLAAARATPYAKPGDSGNSRLAAGVRTGFNRTVIVLDPGTYECVSPQLIGQGIDLIGNGDTRDEVILHNTTQNYCVMPWQGFYLANMTLHHGLGPTGNNYAMHGSVVDAWEQRDFTSIIDNVSMFDENTLSGIAGWDMPKGTRAFVYRTRFESATGHGIVFHDEAGSDVETLFLECEADAPLYVSLGIQDPPVGKTWVVDCTELDGTPIANSTKINGVTSDPPTGIPTTLPTAGMVASEATKYAAGIAAPGIELTPTFPDQTNLSGFTPGRTYYIPIALPQSCKIGGARMNVVTPNGNVSVGAVGGRIPGVDGGGYIIIGDPVTAVAGNRTQPPLAGDTSLWLAAGAKFWLAVRVNSASCVVRASAGMAAEQACYYLDDTATPTTGGANAFPSGVTPLPSGSAVPWAAIVTA